MRRFVVRWSCSGRGYKLDLQVSFDFSNGIFRIVIGDADLNSL